MKPGHIMSCFKLREGVRQNIEALLEKKLVGHEGGGDEGSLDELGKVGTVKWHMRHGF